jgi:hypothetical protein
VYDVVCGTNWQVEVRTNLLELRTTEMGAVRTNSTVVHTKEMVEVRTRAAVARKSAKVAVRSRSQGASNEPELRTKLQEAPLGGCNRETELRRWVQEVNSVRDNLVKGVVRNWEEENGRMGLRR